jgi:hypothetical protein
MVSIPENAFMGIFCLVWMFPFAPVNEDSTLLLLRPFSFTSQLHMISNRLAISQLGS